MSHYYNDCRRFGTYVNHPSADLETVRKDVLGENPENPFLFLNEGRLKTTAKKFQEYFLPNNPYRAIAYALKANPNPRIIQILLKSGIAHFDCASIGEIRAIRYEDDGNAMLFFNNPHRKKLSSIKAAFKVGVRHFTVQSHSEIEDVLNSCPADVPHESIELAVRMKSISKDATINLSEAFGVDEQEGRKIIRFINYSTKASPGISCHIGSQHRNPNLYASTIHLMAKIAKEEGGVKTFNIGGGYPVNYFDDDNFDVKEYLNIITENIEKYVMGILHKNPKIITEPGRAMVAECVDLYIPILEIEIWNGKKYVHIDDGIKTCFMDIAVHQWKYNFKTFGRNNRKLSAVKTPCILVGREFFDSYSPYSDVLQTVSLPEDIARGDYVTLSNAGAYMDCQAVSFPTPNYVYYNIIGEPFTLNLEKRGVRNSEFGDAH
jgi:ornithine decarboxylase